MYIAPGMVRLTAQSFKKTGKYHVKLFSHYHRDAFCEFSASKQLKPEYLSACRSVGYRVCDFSVDTRERKFQIGVPWSCTFLCTYGSAAFRNPETWIPLARLGLVRFSREDRRSRVLKDHRFNYGDGTEDRRINKLKPLSIFSVLPFVVPVDKRLPRRSF